MTDNRKRLAATGEQPVLQTVLEWLGGMDVDKALEISDTVHNVLKTIGGGSLAYAAAFRACESPSERQFLLGALMTEGATGWRPLECGDDGAVTFCKAVIDNEEDRFEYVKLEPQVEFADPDWVCPKCDGRECDHEAPVFARCDFLLEAHGEEIAIEIDGHEFHDRTKEQATADRARDRKLVRACVESVVRFTASEVYKNPQAAFAEALEITLAIYRRKDEQFAMGVGHGLWKAERAAAQMKQLPATTDESTEVAQA